MIKLLNGIALVVLACVAIGCTAIPVNKDSDGPRLSAKTHVPEKDIVFASHCRFDPVNTNDFSVGLQPRIIVATTNAFHLLVELFDILRVSPESPLHFRRDRVLRFDEIQSGARSQLTNQVYQADQLQLTIGQRVFVIEVIDDTKKRISDKAGNEILFKLLQNYGIPVIKPERHYGRPTGGGKGSFSPIILLAI